jgi:hypothetical protein
VFAHDISKQCCDASRIFALRGVQTLLEKFKAAHHPGYKGIPADKISPTVGMNGSSMNALFASSGVIDQFE